MASLADDFDIDVETRGKEATFAHSDVTLVEIGDVMEPIDFVDPFQTLFFNHGEGTTRILFSGLAEQSDAFI